jgi:hypothetical protein
MALNPLLCAGGQGVGRDLTSFRICVLFKWASSSQTELNSDIFQTFTGNSVLPNDMVYSMH